MNPGVSLKIPKSLDDSLNYTPMPRHYQPAESEAKFILVDLSEQFLGAYEYGQLIFSGPITAGAKKNAIPRGKFRIADYGKTHKSSLYQIENTIEPYPMSYGLRSYIDGDGLSYWIHGRVCLDIPPLTAASDCTMRTCSVIITNTPKSQN